MRRLSFVLLSIQAIALVFPTLLGAMFLVGTSGHVWNNGQVVDPLIWTLVLLGLVSAWWLILAYLYAGQQAARRVPVAVWLFCALVSLVALLEFTVGFGNSPLQAFAPGVLFVPTFAHLSGEVWLRSRSHDT